MENLLEIKKLNAWYSENTPIIKELSMTIEKNTVIGLLGLNGAGKTTLINTLCGLHNGMNIDTALFNGKEISFRDNSFKKNRYVVFSEDDSLEYFTFDEYISVLILGEYLKFTLIIIFLKVSVFNDMEQLKFYTEYIKGV